MSPMGFAISTSFFAAASRHHCANDPIAGTASMPTAGSNAKALNEGDAKSAQKLALQGALKEAPSIADDKAASSQLETVSILLDKLGVPDAPLEECEKLLSTIIRELKPAVTPPRITTFNDAVAQRISTKKKDENNALSSLLWKVIEGPLASGMSLALRSIAVPVLASAGKKEIIAALCEPTKLPIVHGESGCGKTTAALQAATEDEGGVPSIALYCRVTGSDFSAALEEFRTEVEKLEKEATKAGESHRARKSDELQDKLKVMKAKREEMETNNMAWLNLGNDSTARSVRCSVVKKVLEKYIRGLAEIMPARRADVPSIDIDGVPSAVHDSSPFAKDGTRVTVVIDEVGASMPILHSLCADLHAHREHIAKLLHLQCRSDDLYNRVRFVAVGTGGYDSKSLEGGSQPSTSTSILLAKDVSRYAVWKAISDISKYPHLEEEVSKCLSSMFDIINDQSTHWATLAIALVGNSRMAALFVEAAIAYIEKLLGLHYVPRCDPHLANIASTGIVLSALPATLTQVTLKFKALNATDSASGIALLRKFSKAAALMHSGFTGDLPDELRDDLVIKSGILTDHARWGDKEETTVLRTSKDKSGATQYFVIPASDPGQRYRLSPTYAAMYALMCGCLPQPLDVGGEGFEMLTAEFLALLIQAACRACDDSEIGALMVNNDKYLDPFGTKKLFFTLVDLLKASGGSSQGGAATRGVKICQMARQWQPISWSKKLPEDGFCDTLVDACTDQSSIGVLLNARGASGADLLVVVAPGANGVGGGVLHIQCKNQESTELTNKKAEAEIKKMKAVESMVGASGTPLPNTKKVLSFMKAPKTSHSYWVFKTVASVDESNAKQSSSEYNYVRVPLGSNALGPLIAAPRVSTKGLTLKDAILRTL